MLEFLRIRNLALIEDVEMNFSPGLNVLTGESGAGKSFILSALDFILGERISPSVIRAGCEKAQVEAIFVLDGQQVILRREILAETGRSRIYMNDSLGSQEKAQALRPSLLIHTSQHGQQKLLRPGFHVRIVDGFLEDPGILARHRERVREMTQILEQEKEIRERIRGLEEKRDVLEYQQKEIQEVGPRPHEEEDLLAEKTMIQAQADSREMIQQSLEIINGQEFSLLEGLGQLHRHIGSLAALDKGYALYAAHIEEARQGIVELDRELRSEPMDFACQSRLEAIESRLWKLTQLQRRFKRSLDRILDLKQEIENNIELLDKSHLDLTQLKRQRTECAAQLGDLTRDLNAARSRAARILKERLETSLRDLGFPDKVEIVFEVEPKEVCPGIVEDRPRIFWVPNPGQPPQPLDKIASGGELSRFLLAVVGLRAEKNMPTLLFDEVDSGIGGITLNRVAASIQDLARRQQVILITHWPRLAAIAERHFHIHKQVRDGNTFTLCSRLGDEEIVAELARMAGGGQKGMMLAHELREK